MNLADILIPGERVAAVPGRTVMYRDGSVAALDDTSFAERQIRPHRRLPPTPHVTPARIIEPAGSLRLF